MSLFDLKTNLLRWYKEHKRELPFRAPLGQQADPYYVLVSEMMLQQTTVQTVIPYFERFIQAFPTPKALAQAELEEVYQLWQGLGYYSRASNLHQAAKQLVLMKEFPKEVKILQTLKGVGPYTSAAVAAIAFNQPVIPIDGNVMRVFSRLFHLTDPKGPQLEKRCQSYTSFFIDEENNKDTAQALMELGALVCRPQSPKCEICPLQQGCKAFELNLQNSLPLLLPKPLRPHHHETVFLLQNEQDQWLILKRPPKGLFAHLYIFPTTSFQAFPLPLALMKAQTFSQKIRHIFTHFELTLTLVQAKIAMNPIKENIFPSSPHPLRDPPYRWVSQETLWTLPMPTLMKKVKKEVFHQEA